MKTVIVGAGQVGYNLAEQLILEKRDVVLIEKNASRARYAAAHLDCLVLHADANNLEEVRAANLDDTHYFVAATDSDEVNIIACFLVGAEFPEIKKIARVRNLYYLKTTLFSSPHLGIDFVVNQETEAAKAILDTVRHGAITDVIAFENTRIELRKLFIDADSSFRNQTLKRIKGDIQEDFLIAGIIRDEGVIVPTGSTRIEENDHIYLAAVESTMDHVLEKAGKIKSRLRHVVYIGGSTIGGYVAGYLARNGYVVRLVDRNEDKCLELAESLPDVLVLNGDISDESIFQDERLAETDLIITATENEELNILAGVYAKTKGAGRALALVSRPNYLNLAANLGIDATVSPKLSSVNAIVQYLRRGNIRSIHTLFDGRSEVIEFTLSDRHVVVGTALKDLRVPKNALVLAIRRDGADFIPDGHTVLQANDLVMVFVKKNAIEKLERLLA
ncbi:MAG: Trk system potassium transporter TrkA, partial [Holophagae bacterium]|nr:Trk system potassium transporter TrkA [Holophagae bacterium]